MSTTGSQQPSAALIAQLQEAVTFHQRGQFAEAAERYQAILRADPNHFDALQLLGAIANAYGQFAEADHLLTLALALNPAHAPALFNRSIALFSLNRFEEAIACCDRALAVRPNYSEVLTMRGSALWSLNRGQEALESYERALALNAQNAEAWNNRSVVLLALDQPEEALASAERALQITPTVGALYNRANALRYMHRLDEAIRDYDQVIAVAPQDHKAQYNAGLSRLMKGDFAGGWPQFEWRWENPPLIGHKRDFAAPQWRGEDIAGKTVLLHAEQGFGDTIQFCRYAPLVAARGATVILEVFAPLKALLRSLGENIRFADEGPLPRLDCQCPLLSLPLAFGTTVDTVPGAPYLQPPQESVEKWKTKLAALAGPLIGIAWAGNPDHPNDRMRSVSLQNFAPLAAKGGTLISLQKDVSAADQAWLNQNKAHHFGIDFTETAALISQLDLVISVDTSLAHLAGALGKKLRILMQNRGGDWRWMVDRTDTPWYPTARIVRQNLGEGWESVIARAVDA